MSYLPYDEPGITVILSLTSFLVLLNVIRYVFDKLLYCGMIGEILIGIVWGRPVGGTSWLSEGDQISIQAFGYLGLIGMVFEGGLSTDLSLLRRTMMLSVSVATVGLLLPIALSFLLLFFPFASSAGTVYPTPLACFSAGASLCSTSLGTTFAILSAAGLQKTRTGVMIIGAAMMDDVVGLVMVNIVTTLGNGGSSGWSIARPIAASFGILIATLLITPYIFKPIWRTIATFFAQQNVLHNIRADDGSRIGLKTRAAAAVYNAPHATFVLSTFVLITYVTIADFVDGSVLFAAYLAGGVSSYLWVREDETQELSKKPMTMFDDYFRPVLSYVLVPFFFASIGFSIPITSMFAKPVVWKGILYSTLMVIAKAATGLILYGDQLLRHFRDKAIPSPRTQPDGQESDLGGPHVDAALLGFAMVARGEIGFLIASLSQSTGTLMLKRRGDDEQTAEVNRGEDLFLVIIWSVVICTLIGPVAVGIIMRGKSRPRRGES